MRMSLSTSANTVGCTYQPLSMPVGPAVAADDDAGALLLAEGDVLLDPLLLALGDERADLGGGVGRVADLHAARPSSPSGVDDLVVAARGEARMRVWATQAWPLFMSDANLRPSIGGGEVGVVEDDGGRLAAELEAAPA